MEISVVIPTHKRPEMLRSTLSSVAAQSRPDLIREVIVSENGDDAASKRVCAEFSGLPLRHVNRQPTLAVLEHFETLVKEAKSPWVAWIADDDMWGRYHLAEAERLLALHPEAVAHVSACVLVDDEARQIWGGYGLTLDSLLRSSQLGLSDHEVWSLTQVLLETLLRTPVNLWGLVCRKEVLLKAAAGWRASGKAWDNDRLFWCCLIREGSLVIGREVGLFYRIHALSEASKYSRQAAAWNAASAQTTRDVIAHATACGIDLRSEWARVWQALSPAQRERFLQGALPGAVAGLRQAWGEEALATGNGNAVLKLVKRACRAICPPVVWQALSNLRRKPEIHT